MRIRATEAKRAEDSARLGLERNSDGLLQLRLRAPSSKALSLVVQLGHAESSPADEGGRRDAQAAIRQHHYILTTPDYQRCQRITQRKDSMGEVHRSRIPQQTELHSCDLFSLRRPGSGTVTHYVARRPLLLRIKYERPERRLESNPEILTRPTAFKGEHH